MKNKELKKLQITELEILKEIDRVCKKHKIEYFLMYGTLLGAIRHDGFIPWDDDVDICMLREDYDKFLKVATSELKEKFKIFEHRYTPNCYFSYAKVCNVNTEFIEKSAIKYKKKTSIWVDIIPLDYVTKNYLKRNKIVKFLSALIVSKELKLNTTWKQKLFVWIPSKVLFIIFDRFIENSNKKSEKLIFYSDLDSKDIVTFNISDVFPLKEKKFENSYFLVPNNYDTILKSLYGDYMKLPPKEKRVTHNPVKLVFEDGEKVEFEDTN